MTCTIPIHASSVDYEATNGLIYGATVIDQARTLGEMTGYFANEEARAEMDPTILVYSLSTVLPVKSGKAGGLHFGSTSIRSGSVDGEYFMTKGHFHSKRDTGEFYWGIKGEGLLLLMEEDRSIKAERMGPGTVHYIPGRVAHRAINTGDEVLVFSACWPSDAGHNYQKIKEEGFSARVFRGPDGPEIVTADSRPILLDDEPDEPDDLD